MKILQSAPYHLNDIKCIETKTKKNSLSGTHTNSILVETRHGGHLGFFESGILTPDPVTWLDRSALQYAEAIVTLYTANKLPHLKFKLA